MRIGVSIATRKFPVQFPAVVMDTAAPRTLRGNISLVTTQATGLRACIHRKWYKEIAMANCCSYIDCVQH